MRGRRQPPFFGAGASWVGPEVPGQRPIGYRVPARPAKRDNRFSSPAVAPATMRHRQMQFMADRCGCRTGAIGRKRVKRFTFGMSELFPLFTDRDQIADVSSLRLRANNGSSRPHSITSSASTSKLCGIVSPSASAVLRLMARSNLVDCSKGMSAGFVPRKILSATQYLSATDQKDQVRRRLGRLAQY